MYKISSSPSLIISRAWKDIEQAEALLNEALASIRKAQAECSHKMHFSRQVNNLHEKEWQVTYRCAKCIFECTEIKSPVCENDDAPLVRVGREDNEAEAERQKPEYQGYYNPPIAFRCPTCQKIHILWLSGD